MKLDPFSHMQLIGPYSDFKRIKFFQNVKIEFVKVNLYEFPAIVRITKLYIKPEGSIGSIAGHIGQLYYMGMYIFYSYQDKKYHYITDFDFEVSDEKLRKFIGCNVYEVRPENTDKH